MNTGILMSADSGVDFMIHGIFSYNFFGHEGVDYNDTCMPADRYACDYRVCHCRQPCDEACLRSAWRLPECCGDDCREAGRHDSQCNGKECREVCELYRNDIYFILISNISGLFGSGGAHSGLRCDASPGSAYVYADPFTTAEAPELSGVLKGLCEPWPIWAPINIIGDVAVPISLSLRLFANVLSGTVMMALVYGLLKWFAVIWPAALHVF